MKGVGSLLAVATALTPNAAPAFPSAPATVPAAAHAATAAPEPIARGVVSGVSVESGAVVVRVDRRVEVQDFTLDAPRRVVLDLTGVSLAPGMPRPGRGGAPGVVNVRVAQYRPGVVRVVVELDGRRAYRVERTDGAVRLVLDGSAPDAQPPVARAALPDVPSLPNVTGVPSLDGAGAPAAGTADVAAAAMAATQPPRGGSRPIVREPARNTIPRDAVMRDARQSRQVAARDARDARDARETRDAEAGSQGAGRDGTLRRPPRLTVTYQEADIRDVIAAFAAYSGRTIIVGRDVAGTVTAEIKDQPWDVALAAVLRTQSLAAREDANGIITVDSYRNIASTRAVEPLVTQIIAVNYARASSLVGPMQALLSRDCTPGEQQGGGGGGGAAAGGGQGAGVPRGCMVRGSVTADTATNKLLITDVPSNLTEVVNRLKELDIRTPQVAIKAKIVFVNRTGLEDIGVSYDLGTGLDQFFSRVLPRVDPSTMTPITGPDGRIVGMGGGTPFNGDRVALGGNALSALANADRAVAPSALNLIYSAAIGRFQLTSFINALQQTSLADVQSEPSIVTLNNRTAEIFVGQQIPIRVIDASAGGGGGGGGGAGGQAFPRATVRLEEAGIRLSVTPQVTNNRRIVLSVNAENSNAQVGSSDVGVIFNRQRANNQLLVADGETAVIGGLTVTERSKTRTGIPFLVDLPFVGRLFGQTTTNEIKRDLIILITPTILDEGEKAPIPSPRR
ncbi:MAG TPA: AMIN domain-containing protein [Gemmatirosa sp.]|nr:AMIN domain-containing protein [Gemmatirosa sp.]